MFNGKGGFMVNSKYKVRAVSVAAGFMLAAAPGVALAANGNSNAGNKVTICHATGSQTNPFVVITPNANGVVNGHISHQDGRDIIPSFTYNDHGTTKTFPGQNFDAAGQAIFNNGCQPVSTTGGQGGGGNPEVLGNVTGGQGAGQVAAVPQGSVNGGGGIASSTLSKASAVGLVGSLLSAGAGLALLNRRQS
jgi:hypothetical protein